MSAKTYTKESLIDELQRIKAQGWIETARNPKNAGVIGNVLEDLLGIQENNLPIPNAAEWELKTQRKNTTSLLTLFHMEPLPTALKIVTYLLKKFGWRHNEAGKKYPDDERSFRQTLSYHNMTSRGFDLRVDDTARKIFVTFDFDAISPEHEGWKQTLIHRQNTHLEDEYTPYWGFNDVFHKAGTKLPNCFYAIADEKKENNKYFVKYEKILMLSDFRMDRFIDSIKKGNIYIDFDARTGHNHGTKFRVKSMSFPELYNSITVY